MKKLAFLLFFQLIALNLLATGNEVGSWTLNEGSGSTVTDSSGQGNNGTWAGNNSGTSGHYSAGYTQTWAGTFDGSTNSISLGSPAVLNRSSPDNLP